MTRSILPPFLRARGAHGRLYAGQRRSWARLPPTPPIDPWMTCGVSLVELARVAEEVAS